MAVPAPSQPPSDAEGRCDVTVDSVHLKQPVHGDPAALACITTGVFSERTRSSASLHTLVSKKPGGLMKIRDWLTMGYVALLLVSPLFASEVKAPVDKKQEQEASFVKTMKGFVRAEGLSGEIQPSYVCQSGQEVCGQVTGNLEELLKTRPDFLPDTYNFHRAHPGSTCSYRGKSGSSHYSLHIVCYGADAAGVHIDVRMPEGIWGNFEHNIRDVAENYFKIHVLRMKNSHTSEMQLARNFSKWWRSYQTAYPELAPREIPTDTAELLNGQKQKVQNASLPGYASGFR